MRKDPDKLQSFKTPEIKKKMFWKAHDEKKLDYINQFENQVSLRLSMQVFSLIESEEIISKL